MPSDKDMSRQTKVAIRASEIMGRQIEMLKKQFPEPFMKKKATPMPKEQDNGMV